MHPRSRFSPPLASVFHVTNSGNAVSSTFCRVLLRLLTLVPALPAALLAPVAGVESALEQALEAVEGERRREMAAGLAGEGASRSVSAVGTEVLGVLVVAVYLVHSASTWRRERAGRFSSDAASVSKQYAQCASDAIVWVLLRRWRWCGVRWAASEGRERLRAARSEKRKGSGGRGVKLGNLQYICVLVKQPKARLCRQQVSDRWLRRRLLRTLRGTAVQERL